MRLTKAFIILYAVAALSAVPFEGMAQSDSESPFTVEPVYPGNQVEPDAGYWYFDASSGMSQTLTANVRNTGSKDITVAVESADCYTSTGGDLCYITDNKSPLVYLTDERFLLAKAMSLPSKSLSLKAGEMKAFSFTVTAPGIEAGEVLGAIRFSVTTPGQGAGKNTGGGNTQINLNIKNAVTLTVRLRYKAYSGGAKPGFSIGNAGVDTGSGAPYFTVINLLPEINREVRGAYDVYDSRNKRLFGASFDLVKMAPVSAVKVPVRWVYPNAEPGKYSISVRSDALSKPVLKSFQITGDTEIAIETEQPPGAAPQLPKVAADNKLLIYGGWILFTLTLLFMLAFIPAKRKKRGDKEKSP